MEATDSEGKFGTSMEIQEINNCMGGGEIRRTPIMTRMRTENDVSAFSCQITDTEINGGLREGIVMLFDFFRCYPACFFILAVVLYFSPILLGLALIIIMGLSSKNRNSKCKRTINWIIDTEDLVQNFLSSPNFKDKCGQWRLLVQHRSCIEGTETSLGIIAADIPKETDNIFVSAQFSCVNHFGQDLSPGFGSLSLKQTYTCPGDSGFTRPFVLNDSMIDISGGSIIVSCKAEFEQRPISVFKAMLFRVIGNPKFQKRGRNDVPETGTITSAPPQLSYHSCTDVVCNYQMVMDDPVNGIPKFLQHDHTKSFIWEIPNFSLILDDADCWGLFSPTFFLNSHDFCSIWRLKLIELQGVFRIHLQLRGLPRQVNQVKLWYLLQMFDLYGNPVVPENAITRVKYPDHINLWESVRHILYRRDYTLQRFLSRKGSLIFRVSLQADPNDLPILEASDSDDWILAQEN